MFSSITGEKGFYGYVNLAVTAVMGVVGNLYIVAFGYLLKPLLDEFGWSRGITSLTATINMIALGLCGPLAGHFIVKYGAKRAIVMGNCLGCLGFFMLFFHNHLWELFLGYGVMVGLAAGFGGLLAATTVLTNWFVKKRSFALGVFLGTGGVGGIFVGPAMVQLITIKGWRFTCLVMSVMVLLLAVILPALLIKNKPQDLGQAPDGPDGAKSPVDGPASHRKATYKTPVDFSAKEAMRTRALWLLIAYFCMNMLAMGALMTHQVTYLREIGNTAFLAGVALSVMTAVMAFAQFATGYVGMRFSMLSIAVCGEISKLIGVAILVSTHDLPIIFLAMVILGMGFGTAMVATWNIFPNYFGLSHYPKIMGTSRIFWTFVGGAGAPLAGFIRERSGSYLPAFYLAIGVLTIGLACLVFAQPPMHPSLKGAEPVDTLADA